jgi:hypothetical protein
LTTDFISSGAFPAKTKYIALNGFAGKKTTPVFRAFQESGTVTFFIPEGCIGLVQPLDTTINKIWKAKISKLLDKERDKNPEMWELGKFSLGDRTIFMTWVVGDAWDLLHREKKYVIVNTFGHVVYLWL